MKKAVIIIVLALLVLSCHKVELPHTDKTKGLVAELLAKLDSTNVYAAKKDKEIEALKLCLPGETVDDDIALYYDIAMVFSNNAADSALAYMEKANRLALDAGRDSLGLKTQIVLATLLSEYGYYLESHEVISSVPREELTGELLFRYYHSVAQLYQNLYTDFNVPGSFRKKYRDQFNIYRDSLILVADTLSMEYLRSVERKDYTITQWTGHSSLKAMKPYMAIADKVKKESMKKFDEV